MYETQLEGLLGSKGCEEERRIGKICLVVQEGEWRGHIDANKEYRLRLCHRYFLERISHVPSHNDKAGSLAPILPHHFCLH